MEQGRFSGGNGAAHTLHENIDVDAYVKSFGKEAPMNGLVGSTGDSLENQPSQDTQE